MSALLLALLAAGCGAGTASTASEPPGEAPSASPRPTAVPAAPGAVHTRSLVTVMDTGRPEVCLGPVAESWPPQCGGPELIGWDWSAHQAFEKQGKTRWGQFAITGTWDGTALTVTDAVAAALYDPMLTEPEPTPSPAVELTQEELDAIAEDVGTLPGAQGAYAADGQVLVDVVYDDGSLQAWADEEYGESVVLVTGALVDAD